MTQLATLGGARLAIALDKLVVKNEQFVLSVPCVFKDIFSHDMIMSHTVEELFKQLFHLHSQVALPARRVQILDEG